MYAERWQEKSNEPPAGANFFVSCDLGQANDYSAIAIIQKVGPDYHVRKLERTRGTPYPDVIRRIKSIMSKLRGAALVVDQTGVGRPIVDSMEEVGLRPVAVSIHGGDRVAFEADPHGWMPRRWRVPKRDLVGCLQVLLQNKRLKIAPGPLSDTLAEEMLNFKVTIDPTTSHDSYSAWREQDHDDLVLSVALAVWYAENKPRPPIISTPQIASYTRGHSP